MANPATQTAVGPMVIVAVEQYTPAQQRVITDHLAVHFLPAGTRLIVRLARWAPLRRRLIAVTEQQARELWASMLCRKRYIDDLTRAAANAVDGVVILGAGLDTRAYRLPELRDTSVVEVDLPENTAAKQARVRAHVGELPSSVRLVPIDFETQDLATVLGAAGYDLQQRRLFIWEAVTQYLTDEAVRATVAVLARAAPSSRLVFTYVRRDFLDGTNLYDAAPTYERFRVKQQLWRFGLAPEQVGAFVGGYGWREVEQCGSQAYTARYIRPSGRLLDVTELERAVYAEKP